MLAHRVLRQDPFSGHLFMLWVASNRLGTRSFSFQHRTVSAAWYMRQPAGLVCGERADVPAV